MVGIQSHPPGVSGKSVTTFGINPTQSPIGNEPSSPSVSNINPNEVFQNLISSIEGRNCMVRKLNEFKHYQREDQDHIEMVSDDEVEVDLPNNSAES